MTTLKNIDQNVAQKEQIINQNFKSLSGYGVLTEKPSEALGLTYYYYGGLVNNQDGTITDLSDGSVSMTSSSTEIINYVEYNTNTKTVTVNQLGFTEGCYPMSIVKNTTNITSTVNQVYPNFKPFNKNQNKTFLSNITLSTTLEFNLTDLPFSIQNTGTSYITQVKLIATTANSDNTLNEEIEGFALINDRFISLNEMAYLDRVNSKYKVIIPSAIYIFRKSDNTFVQPSTLANYKVLLKIQ